MVGRVLVVRLATFVSGEPNPIVVRTRSKLIHFVAATLRAGIRTQTSHT
jgi:hypothetical protein